MKTKFTIALEPDLAWRIRNALLSARHTADTTDSQRFQLQLLADSIYEETTITVEAESKKPK